MLTRGALWNPAEGHNRDVTTADVICAIWMGLSLLVAPTFLVLALMWKRTARRYQGDPVVWPDLSIIRPIRGTSPELYHNLESALTAMYPAKRELLCCIEEEDDPAREVIQRLQWNYPDEVRLVISHGEGSIFGKHANLIAGYSASQYPVIVCSDADVTLLPDNLLELIPPLFHPKVGGSTAVFWQPPMRGAASWIMSAFVTAYGYVPNLAARQVRQLPNAIGGLMAYRKDILEELGGFVEIIHNKISDDGALGNAVWGSGRELYLCVSPFVCIRKEPSLGAIFRNCHRWMLMFKNQGSRAYLQMPAVSPWFPLLGWTLVWYLGFSSLTAEQMDQMFVGMLVWEGMWGALSQDIALPIHNTPVTLGLARPLAQLIYTVSWIWALFTDTTEWGGRRYRIPLGGKATLLGPVAAKSDRE